ncbi:hypothetical protein [Microcoleus vaginatus]
MRYRIGLGRGDKSQIQGPDTAMPFPYRYYKNVRSTKSRCEQIV